MTKPVERAEWPAKMGCLFEPHRYKVFYGGRGGGRSWGCARALIVMAAQRPLRVACVREIQESIKKSVHQLLKDQISLLGFDLFFDVQETVIKGRNGSEFSFSGLSTMTRDSIKSMEGCDIAWCEEAQSISDGSWDILIPTIRKEGSEIWITFNPSLETDPTFQRFVLHPPPNSAVVKLNYHDNPWFPAVLETERKHCFETNPDDYPNIWEGECKPAVEGAIYFKQIQTAEKNGQICRVPHDPMLKTHVVLDLGFSNFMSVSMVQRHLSEIRFIDYFQVQGATLNDISLELRKRPYNWGKVWPPHDAWSTDHKSGITSAAILKKLGWNVPNSREEINELSIEEGIRLVKQMFPQMYFDQVKCGDVIDNRANGGMIWGGLIECLKRYRRRFNRETGVFGAPVHDNFSDGADCARYVAVNASEMRNETDRPKRVIMPGYGARDSMIGL